MEAAPPSPRPRNAFLRALPGLAAALVSGGSAILFYNLYGPTKPRLHELAHRTGWPSLGGLRLPYQGIDGKEHTGLFCDQCARLFDEHPICPDPQVPHVQPLAKAISEPDAINLLSRVVFNNSLEMHLRNDQFHRLLQLQTPDSSHRSELALLMHKHGFANWAPRRDAFYWLFYSNENTCRSIPAGRNRSLVVMPLA